MAATLLELSFPPNWWLEAEAEILWVDEGSGREQGYGKITQGAHKQQETFGGHRWRLRGKGSRELLGETVVAPSAPGGPPHTLVAGAKAPHAPAEAACWKLGTAAREPLLRALTTLLKVVGNAARSPDEEKYRSLRVGNPSVAACLDVPGALALLSAAGFEQQGAFGVGEGAEARLVLPATAPRALLLDASTALERLQTLLQGGALPRAPDAPPEGGGGGGGGAASSSSDDGASHRCAHCRRGIMNDIRSRRTGSSWETGRDNWEFAGEFRYRCEACAVDLCAACYDKRKGGDATVHNLACDLRAVAPITNPWGGGYGAPPAPPPPSSRNRRGPWG